MCVCASSCIPQTPRTQTAYHLDRFAAEFRDIYLSIYLPVLRPEAPYAHTYSRQPSLYLFPCPPPLAPAGELWPGSRLP